MARVSSKQTTTPQTESPLTTKAAQPYIASRDYGTRGAELEKRILSFGQLRATLYRRPDVERSSWFLRVHLKEEGRHYRKSLQTFDRVEAEARAQTEIVNVLAKIQSGQRILAVSLRELERRFSLHLESQAASGQLSPRTLIAQQYRIKLGCEFLKEKLPAGLETKVSSLDGTIFQDYLQWRQARAGNGGKRKPIRRDVVRDELLVIRKMFKFARSERLCPERAMPTWDFPVEREGAKRERMTQRNYTDFINCVRSWAGEARNDKERYNRRLLQHVVLTIANSGMRSGEIFGLRNSDLRIHPNAQECVATIRPETSKVRRGRQITISASGGGRVTDTKNINYMLRWTEQYQRYKGANDYVFSPYDDGSRTARDVFYHAYGLLRAKLREIQLDWFDAYHCRHFWITNRLLAEEPIHVVARAAGTSTAEIEKTYSHVLTEMATRRFNRKRVVYGPDGSYEVVETKKIKSQMSP